MMNTHTHNTVLFKTFEELFVIIREDRAGWEYLKSTLYLMLGPLYKNTHMHTHTHALIQRALISL